MAAAEQVGEDGNGLDGVIGYLRRLAVSEPAVFGGLLKKLLPTRIKTDLDSSSVILAAMESARARVLHGQATIDLTPSRSKVSG